MKAKKFLFIPVFFLFGILTASGQSKFSAGVKAGFGIPSLTAGSKTTPLSEGYSSRFGLYGGLISELQTGKHFGLRIELNYSSQGGKRDGMQAMPITDPNLIMIWQMLPSTDGYMYASIKSKAILNYLEIPVMAKYRFNISKKVHFYVQAGPYAGILLNAKNVTSGKSSLFVDNAGNIIPIDVILAMAQPPITIGSLDFEQNTSITSDIHRLNAGGQGAVGFGFQTKSGELFIEGGGNYGFIPIQKDDANGTNNTGAGTVVVGYLFHL